MASIANLAASARGKNEGEVRTPVKAMGTFGLLLLIGASYWMFFYDEISTDIARAQSQNRTLQAELTNQQQARSSFIADRDELALRQQRQREFNKVLPVDAQVANFLSSIQQVSNLASVSLDAWQPLDEVNDSFFSRVPMRLEMTGRFHQILKFAYEIGRNDRIINLENISISDPKPVGEGTVVKAKCLATAFHALPGK